MTGRARGTLVRIAALVALTFLSFALLQGLARRTEAQAAIWVLHAVGAENVGMAGATSVYVVPDDKSSFLAVVTPSCSALASVLAIGGLALLAPASSRRRRAFAITAAVLTVAVGNILRIAASLLVGLVAGRGSLVLFHDAVGSVFSFAYTLGGYVLLLYLLLPATPRAPAPAPLLPSMPLGALALPGGADVEG